MKLLMQNAVTFTLTPSSGKNNEFTKILVESGKLYIVHGVEPFFKRCRFLHFCLLMGVVQSTHFCSRAVNCCFTWIEKVFEALVLVWRFATNTSSMAAWVPYELNPHVVNYRVRSLVSQIIRMLRDTSKLPLFQTMTMTLTDMTSTKVQIFWEGHKIWKKISHHIWCTI